MGKNEAWFLCEPVLSWQCLGIKPTSAEVFCFNRSCRVPFFSPPPPFSLMLLSLCPFFTWFMLCPSLPDCCAAHGHPGPVATWVQGSRVRPASAPAGGGCTAEDAAAAGRPGREDGTGRVGCGGLMAHERARFFSSFFFSSS